MIRFSCPELRICAYDQIANWDSFVHVHPRGSIFHTLAMIRCESQTKLHTPYAIGALDSKGDICAILVAVRIALVRGVGSKLTSRSIFFAEPICLDNPLGRAGLVRLLKCHDDYMSKQSLFAEIRPLFTDCDSPWVDCGYLRRGYLNYELTMNGDEEQLFKQLHSKCRNNIRSSQKKGVTVEQVVASENIDLVYSLIRESYSRSKVPIVDRSLFTSALESLGDRLSVFVARYQGRTIATGCFLTYKDRVICWYAGTLRISGVYATSCIFWDAICKFSKLGYRVFDFSGAGWEGESYGPGRFKSKFGGAQTNFGRYRKVFSPWKMKAAEVAYEHFRELISPSTNFPISNREGQVEHGGPQG